MGLFKSHHLRPRHHYQQCYCNISKRGRISFKWAFKNFISGGAVCYTETKKRRQSHFQLGKCISMTHFENRARQFSGSTPHWVFKMCYFCSFVVAPEIVYDTRSQFSTPLRRMRSILLVSISHVFEDLRGQVNALFVVGSEVWDVFNLTGRNRKSRDPQWRHKIHFYRLSPWL